MFLDGVNKMNGIQQTQTTGIQPQKLNDNMGPISFTNFDNTFKSEQKANTFFTGLVDNGQCSLQTSGFGPFKSQEVCINLD